MRMLLNVKFPNAEFSNSVRDGSAGQKIGQILEGENRGNGENSALSLYECFSSLIRANSRATVDGWTLKSRAASAAVF